MSERMPTGDWLRLRWWRFLDHFHRCPECGHWPDAHRDNIGPRWEDDKIAAMLGIGRYGCRRCGHGAIEERACDNPPCVNPAHISWGTQAQNVLDSYRRARR